MNLWTRKTSACKSLAPAPDLIRDNQISWSLDSDLCQDETVSSSCQVPMTEILQLKDRKRLEFLEPVNFVRIISILPFRKGTSLLLFYRICMLCCISKYVRNIYFTDESVWKLLLLKYFSKSLLCGFTATVKTII